jgi:hypothetical protein
MGQKTTKTLGFNLFSAGILFLGFSCLVVARGLDDIFARVLISLTLAFSVLMAVVIVCKPIRDWISEKRSVAKMLWMIVFSFYVIAFGLLWLDSLSLFTGIMWYVVFAIGLIWLLVLILIESAQMRKIRVWPGLLFTAVLFAFGINFLVALQWEVGISFLVFGTGALLATLIKKWEIWDEWPI